MIWVVKTGSLRGFMAEIITHNAL